jgi:hypothetical protein
MWLRALSQGMKRAVREVYVPKSSAKLKNILRCISLDDFFYEVHNYFLVACAS